MVKNGRGKKDTVGTIEKIAWTIFKVSIGYQITYTNNQNLKLDHYTFISRNLDSGRRNHKNIINWYKNPPTNFLILFGDVSVWFRLQFDYTNSVILHINNLTIPYISWLAHPSLSYLRQFIPPFKRDTYVNTVVHVPSVHAWPVYAQVGYAL